MLQASYLVRFCIIDNWINCIVWKLMKQPLVSILKHGISCKTTITQLDQPHESGQQKPQNNLNKITRPKENINPHKAFFLRSFSPNLYLHSHHGWFHSPIIQNKRAHNNNTTQNPKIDSFRPHPHIAEGDLIRARFKYTMLFPKEPPHKMWRRHRKEKQIQGNSRSKP